MVRVGKSSLALGRHGEELVVQYLQSQGMEILDRNWRCPHGELDIVAVEEHSNALVVVEVKPRSGSAFGAPLEAITPIKARRLYQLAHLWCAEHGRPRRFRVDGVGVQFGQDGPAITHLRGITA